TLVERDGAWQVQGDPTEGALLVAARKAGLVQEDLGKRLPRVAEVPFSSERKLMTTVRRDTRDGGHLLVFSKGAPDVLLALCTHEMVGDSPRPLTAARRAGILAAAEALAEAALRTLGVALHQLGTGPLPGGEPKGPQLERELVFAGLIGMIDPPRDEAADSVARARAAGIRPLLITGDHPRTASVIARELGIADDDRVVTGAELARMTEAELDQELTHTRVFARVDPIHKLRIVAALQRAGAIVAMTGDGVNDAPALKKADIGVAMGITGTDVSRQAADLVLADDNFATLVAAVEEGRAIFDNIRKFLRFLLSSNTGEVMTMFFGVLLAERLGLPTAEGKVVLPLLATQVLWINLVTDGAPALAFGVDPPATDLMRHPPRSATESAVTARMWRGIAGVGATMAAATLFVLDASLPGGFVAGSGTLAYAQTMAFTTLVLAQLFNVFNARSGEVSAFVHPFSNPWLQAAVAISLALQALALYLPPMQHAFGTVPLGAADWLACTAAASSVLVLRELWKLAARLRSQSKSPSSVTRPGGRTAAR
ncbi:MAG: cation-translocating P-type ATPase, partial [Thermoanaerobaculia bacterium]|nr:cation-translocating P-type ATPase [Thermoanaerobaculia bacterium]